MSIIQFSDGFVYLDVTEKARGVYSSELFDLYAVDVDWESEWLIESHGDLDVALGSGLSVCIEVGHIQDGRF
jgi:hypothetical protein